MAKAISVRLDDDAERALRILQASGLTLSDAIRSSLLASAERLNRRRSLVEGAATLEADELLSRSVVTVAPTSGSARPASFRPEIEVGGALTRVLIEQLGAVDIQRLGKRVGHVTVEEIWALDDALSTVLGLN